jgi:tyrosyl-tRNA synthetase
MDIKITFAKEIVERFHSSADADWALDQFQNVHSRDGIPDNIPEVMITIGSDAIGIAHMLKQANLVPSTSEAMRMIEQGGVKLDGGKVADKALEIARGSTVIAQVGKRKFAKVHIV